MREKRREFRQERSLNALLCDAITLLRGKLCQSVLLPWLYLIPGLLLMLVGLFYQDIPLAAARKNVTPIEGGTGVFVPHPKSPSFGASSSSSVALGDLDGDGDLDAVVTNFGDEPETVWLNDGMGNFSPHYATPTFGNGNARDVALGDLDNDGDLDAVVANSDLLASMAPPNTVWLNDGSGNFTAHPVMPSFGTNDSFAIDLGDLDDDGDLDAVAANFGQDDTVWLNDGSGSFSAHPDTPSLSVKNRVSDSTSIRLGDLDDDGDLDAVVAGFLEYETVWLNDGAGNFSAHDEMPAFGDGDSVAVVLGNIDGDGDLDAFVVNDSHSSSDGSEWHREHNTRWLNSD